MEKLNVKMIILAVPLLAMSVLSMAGCEENDHHQGQRWYNWNYYHHNEGNKGNGDSDHQQEGNKVPDGDSDHH